jgi:hypothetical protein
VRGEERGGGKRGGEGGPKNKTDDKTLPCKMVNTILSIKNTRHGKINSICTFPIKISKILL